MAFEGTLDGAAAPLRPRRGVSRGRRGHRHPVERHGARRGGAAGRAAPSLRPIRDREVVRLARLSSRHRDLPAGSPSPPSSRSGCMCGTSGQMTRAVDATRPLRVLYFANSLARGGAEEHLLLLAQGLDRSRFTASGACPAELGRTLQADLPADVELIPLRLRGPTDVWPAFRLALMIALRRIDILHSHLSFGSLFASPIGWACRVPVIVETTHLNDPPPRRWARLRPVSDRVVASCIDVSIAVAEANARYLVARKRRAPGKVVVIYNAVDLRRFDPDRRPPGDLLAPASDSRPTLPCSVSIARLQPQKGHRVLLDALALVRRTFPLVRLGVRGRRPPAGRAGGAGAGAWAPGRRPLRGLPPRHPELARAGRCERPAVLRGRIAAGRDRIAGGGTAGRGHGRRRHAGDRHRRRHRTHGAERRGRAAGRRHHPAPAGPRATSPPRERWPPAGRGAVRQGAPSC